MTPFPAAPAPLPGGGQIRPLTEADAPVVAALIADQEPFATLGLSANALAGYLARPDPALHRFLLLTGDAPAGVMVWRHPWLRGPYLELLALGPIAQGHGLGRAAMTWAMAPLPGNVWTCVSAFNTRARAFYESLGFEQAAVLPDLVNAGQDEVLMRKR